MSRAPATLIVGLTGGMGTGKSTVARLLAKNRGVAVIDADQLAHEVLKPGKLGHRDVVRRFGKGILNPDQSVHHKKLATIVFSDDDARRDLEAIVHPRVLRDIKHKMYRMQRNTDKRLFAIVLDVPLLFETGSEKLADVVVVVTASPEVTLARLRERGVSEEDAARRIAAQMDVSAKAALADVVFDNSGDLEQTRRQVSELWQHLVTTRRRRRA